MDMQTYLAKLELALADMQRSQRDTILQGLKAEMDARLTQGVSEQQMIAGLPAPEHLARQKMLQVRYESLRTGFSLKRGPRRFATIAALALSNFLVLIPGLLLASCLFAASVSALGLYGSGVVVSAGAVSGASVVRLELPDHILSLGESHAHSQRQGTIVAIDREIATVTASSIPATGTGSTPGTEALTRFEFIFTQPALIRFAYGLVLILLGCLAALGLKKALRYSWQAYTAYLRWNLRVLQTGNLT